MTSLLLTTGMAVAIAAVALSLQWAIDYAARRAVGVVRGR